MRILLESELFELAKRDVEAARRKLREVDFVFDRNGWFVSPDYYLEKLARSAGRGGN